VLTGDTPSGDDVKILLADDEKTIAVTLGDDLETAGHQVTVAQDGHEASEHLSKSRFDLLISDIRMPGVTGLELLERVKGETPGTDVILITAWGTVETAVGAMKAGAYDYIQKPFLNEKVVNMVERLAQMRDLRGEVEQLRTKLSAVEERTSFANLIGRSERMREVFEMIETLRDNDSDILIVGESGTGKELLAKAIHDNSRREGKPMITLHVAQFPSTLLEAEIFGHEKGAFTDARERKIGRFEQAQGGTLFLDDIDDMPPETQVKLLRVLQERKFERLGGSQEIQLDVRVVAATKIDLMQLVSEGTFREDLYYRLDVVRIDLPPLRDRVEDVPLLADKFLDQFAGTRDLKIAADVMEAMVVYPWPGNVRELQHAVERGVALAGRAKNLRKDHLIRPSPAYAKKIAELRDLRPLKEVLLGAEIAHIRNVLRSTDGHKARAAEILCISRKSLWEKLKAADAE
jgi:DNA-binding NtrC family response regulator